MFFVCETFIVHLFMMSFLLDLIMTVASGSKLVYFLYQLFFSS